MPHELSLGGGLRCASPYEHALAEMVLDKLLCEAYYNPRIIALIQLLVSGGDTTLHLLPVPTAMIGKPFRVLCESLLLESGSKRALAIGLYRSSKDSNGLMVRYVLTKPPVDAILRSTDEFFALVDRGMSMDNSTVANLATIARMAARRA